MPWDSQARNSLYPTEKTIEPTKRPMLPVVRKRPIAPKTMTIQQRIQNVVDGRRLLDQIKNLDLPGFIDTCYQDEKG